MNDHSHNIAAACTYAQCCDGRANKIAMRWIDASGNTTDYSFGDLEILSNRFANVLSSLGLARGDIFFTFLPKMPEQFFSLLGALKLQAICGTLFSNFGEEALLDRLGDSGAVAVITRKSLYRKIAQIRARLPKLKYIILVDGDDEQSAGLISYSRAMAEARPEFDVQPTTPETPPDLPESPRESCTVIEASPPRWRRGRQSSG